MDRLLVAFRYLITRPISIVSVLGVLVGLGAIVVVDSVMNGFLTQQQAMARGSTPDLIVDLPKELRSDAQAVEALRSELEALAPVQAAALRLNWPALHRKSEADTGGRGAGAGVPFQGLYHFVELVGLDPVREHDLLVGLLSKTGGRYEHISELLRPPRLEDPLWFDARDPYWRARVEEKKLRVPLIPVLFGEHLALRSGLRIGDVLGLGSFGERQEDTGKYPPRKHYFVMVGAFRTEDADYDDTHAILRLDDLREFADVREVGSKLVLEVGDAVASAKTAVVAVAARHDIPAEQVRTWQEEKAVLLGAIENERTIMNFVLFFMVVIAAFNPLVTLYMMVSEKVRDIGVLISMGGTQWTVMAIFLTCGAFVTLLGIGLGLFGGLMITWYINEIEDVLEALTGLRLFNPDIYSLPEIPTRVDAARIALFSLATVVCTTLFTLFPAFRAGRMEVVQALRRE